MRPRVLTLILVALLAFALPAAATAQTPTIPENGGGLSTEPPPGLGDDDADRGDPAPDAGDAPDTGADAGADGSGQQGGAEGDEQQETSTLPRTGEDVGTLALAGLALLLVGSGLRLRTADADLY